VQQSGAFANLDLLARELIQKETEQKKIADNHHLTLIDKIDDIDRTTKYRALLESLWFSGIDERQESIKPAAPHTLEWLLGSPSPPGPASDTASDQVFGKKLIIGPSGISLDFRQWLREAPSMYWISGKAGSGKSTLMAHVIQDSRAQELLKTWGKGYELQILSFFFWRGGNTHQKSVQGLLRTLLYRLCNLQWSIADRISIDLPVHGRAIVWDERLLLSTIIEAIELCDKCRFCIFLDGLDEYEGDYHDLVECVNQLQALDNVKVCVSSRPELEFTMRFRDVKKLRLEDLNRGDIMSFVKHSFAKWGVDENTYTDFATKITERAEGVFLWASLVTQELAKAYATGEDEKQLQERLSALPRGLDTLFEQMLSKLGDSDISLLALYVQIMMVWGKSPIDSLYPPDPPISLVATFRLTAQKVNSYDEFSAFCELTKSHIMAISAGLLEVGEHKHDYSIESIWEGVGAKFVNDQPQLTLGSETLCHRRRAYQEEPFRNDPYPSVLRYDEQHMRWVHRSAHEYLSAHELLRVKFSDLDSILQRLIDACIRYAAAAPTCARLEMGWRLAMAFDFIGELDNGDDPTRTYGILDKLYSFYAKCGVTEISIPYRYRHDGRWWRRGEFVGRYVFWDECVSHRCWSYLYAQVDRVLADMDSNSSLAGLVAWSVSAGDHPLGSSFYPENPNRSDYAQFNNRLAERLYESEIEKYNVSRAKRTRLRFITPDGSFRLRKGAGMKWWRSFNCASLEEPASSECLIVMSHLLEMLYLLILFSFSTTSQPYLRRDTEFADYYRIMPVSLPLLMEAADLYVAPRLKLKRLCILLSAKSWTAGGKRWNESEGRLGDYLSVPWRDKALRILCLPRLEHLSELGTELTKARFTTLEPSTGASKLLLSLIRVENTMGVMTDFEIAPGTRQQREEICEMLIQEIQSGEQRLAKDQQETAITCIKVGLLDPKLDISTDRE
jgi:hypothetical protein